MVIANIAKQKITILYNNKKKKITWNIFLIILFTLIPLLLKTIDSH